MAPHKLTKKQLAAQRERRIVNREARTNYQNDDQVLSFPQWCAVNGFSVATGNRLIASGNAPPIVRLTAGRRGFRVGDNRAWQLSRRA